MSTEKEKLERFAKAVDDDVNVQIDEILKQAEISRNEIIEKANDESLYEAYDRIKEEIKKISNKYVKIVSKAELDNKREILLHREKIANQVIDNIKNKLINFTTTDKYYQYLVKLVEDEISCGADVNDLVVYLSDNDIKLSKDIKKAVSEDLKIEVNENIRIGGLSIYSAKENVIKDNTFDSALDEQKYKFNNSTCLRLN